ncbi:MAG TPA: hypothetical protein VNM66_04610, partial [Thermodesulfobacteriota bacterium]|nr:hypothetical protein [Thermodesulfobacteriota bacterium]
GSKKGEVRAGAPAPRRLGGNAETVVREAIAAARALVRRGDYPQALRLLARAEEQVPGARELTLERLSVQRLRDAEVEERIKQGIAKFQREDLEGAIEEWTRALELDPDNTVALDYRKKAQGMLRRIEEIREEARRRGEIPADREGGPERRPPADRP